MKQAIGGLYAPEQLAGGDSCVHRLHPTAKLLMTVVFVVTVVSFDRYAVGRLAPYVLYPTLLTALSETPFGMLCKRFIAALPFCLFAGVTNVIFDRATALTLGGMALSYGFLSLVSIVFKAYLCVMAVLLLGSVTTFSDIAGSLRALRFPRIFVTLLEMTYRYIGVLAEEAYAMYCAYTLRCTEAKGIAMRDMGSFVGQLLLRSFDRAERVYQAMQCRGYAAQLRHGSGRSVGVADAAVTVLVCALCVFFRMTDVYAFAAQITGGGF